MLLNGIGIGIGMGGAFHVTMFEIASRIVVDRPENPSREALRQAEVTGREQGRAQAMPYVAAAILLCRDRDLLD